MNPLDSHEGTVDGGGGNGVSGKPLESFHFDVTALPEYHDLVLGLAE